MNLYIDLITHKYSETKFEWTGEIFLVTRASVSMAEYMDSVLRTYMVTPNPL